MAKLIYTAIASLDGYIEDENGSFDWYVPDEKVHAYINDLERPIGCHIYGRRMYDTMAVWETMDLDGEPPAIRDYAEVWRAADKVVFSRTLSAPTTARTTLLREFDPEAIREMKRTAGRDIGIGGPEIASHAFKAGLVDECHLFVAPVAVGGGKPALPPGVHLEFDLCDVRRFESGPVHLHYRTKA